VVSANVNLATEKAIVTYLPAAARIADFKQAVKETGYEVVEQEEKIDEEEIRRINT
jgi:Cu+-exporting ATPase